MVKKAFPHPIPHTYTHNTQLTTLELLKIRHISITYPSQTYSWAKKQQIQIHTMT